MAIELQNVLPQLASAQFNITVNVTATLNITAYTAKRKVNVLVLNRIGTGLFGDEPSLVVTDKSIVWRVPVSVDPIFMLAALPARQSDEHNHTVAPVPVG